MATDPKLTAANNITPNIGTSIAQSQQQGGSDYVSSTSPTITTDQLKSSAPVNLTDTVVTPTDSGSSLVTGASSGANQFQTDYQRYLDAANQNKSSTTLLDTFNSLGLGTNPKEGMGQAQLDANKTSGYDQYSKDLADVNAQILSKTAEYDKLVKDLEVGTRGSGNADIRASMLYGQQGAVNRQAASEIGLLQAKALGLQGKVTEAQTAANRAIDLMFQDREAAYQSKLNQYNAIKDSLTGEEAKRGKALEYALGIEKTQTEDLKNAKKDGITKIFDMIKEGKTTSTAGYQAISDIQSGKKSLSDIYATLGITGDNKNPGVVGGYDISKYATDPEHEIKVATIYKGLPDFKDASIADSAIKSLYSNSPITGSMIMNAANTFNVDPKMIFSIMAQDSSMGTKGIGAKNFNPGNIGQFDSLGTTPTGGYKNWQEGVNAVGKWLSNHKATGIYNGEFGSTLEQISQLGDGTDKSKAETLLTLQNAIASKDYKNAYQLGTNKIADKLPTAEIKAEFFAKNKAIPVAEDLKVKLQAYVDAHGDMGLLKGTAENIEAKLGKVEDPALRALATELKIAFQAYRKDMSGAAFSVSESADYESVNPTSKKTLALNLAILDGMISSFKSNVDSTISTKASGLLQIRELAEYQGLSQPQILIKLAGKNPNTKSFIESEKAKGTPPDIVLEALGYKNLIQ